MCRLAWLILLGGRPCPCAYWRLRTVIGGIPESGIGPHAATRAHGSRRRHTALQRPARAQKDKLKRWVTNVEITTKHHGPHHHTQVAASCWRVLSSSTTTQQHTTHGQAKPHRSRQLHLALSPTRTHQHLPAHPLATSAPTPPVRPPPMPRQSTSTSRTAQRRVARPRSSEKHARGWPARRERQHRPQTHLANAMPVPQNASRLIRAPAPQ